MPGHRKGLEHPEVSRQRDVGHGLSQLRLVARGVCRADLVDDIDERARFGHTPENTVKTQAEFPLAVAHIAIDEQVGVAQISVGALRIGGVDTVEGRQGEAPAFVILHVDGGLAGKTTGV